MLRFGGLAPVILGVTIALLACEAPPILEAVVVRDSSGVRVVENHSPAWLSGEEWRLEREPRAVIKEVLDPRGALEAVNGGILVVDGMLPGIRLFDSSGTQVTKSRGEGSGPGEFLFPEAVISYAADSFAVFDARANLLSLYSSDGSYGRSVRVRSGYPRISLIGSLDDGAFLFRANEWEQGRRRWRETTWILRVPPDGGLVEKVMDVPGREFFSTVFRGSRTVALVPFGPRTVMVGSGSEIIVHLQDSCVFKSFDASGRLVALHDCPCPRRPVSPDAIRGFLVERVSRYRRESDRARAEALYRSRKVPFPDLAPAFRKMLRDPDDNLWIEVYPLPDETIGEWWVFRKDGRWLGRVEVPEKTELVSVGNRWAFGIEEDDQGVKGLLVYALVRGKPATGARPVP